MKHRKKKFTSLKSATDFSHKQKKAGKKVILVTGCFDLIHFGHVDYFRFAKKHGDVLIVGLDNDENIKKNKGEKRPIFDIQQRAKVLSEFESIDCIFEIKDTVSFVSDEADTMLTNLLKSIQPTSLICHKKADSAFLRKKSICKKLGIQLISDHSEKLSSSTEIINAIRNKK